MQKMFRMLAAGLTYRSLLGLLSHGLVFPWVIGSWFTNRDRLLTLIVSWSSVQILTIDVTWAYIRRWFLNWI